MKKSYMVAVVKRYEVSAVVYAEVVAKNSKDALKKAKAIKFTNEHFKDEVAICVDAGDYSPKGKVKFVNAGLSSEYHAPEGCRVCSSVKGKK